MSLINLHRYLKLQPFVKLIMLFTIVNLVIAYIFSLISSAFFKEDILENFLKFDSIYEELLLLIVFAPLLETFLFQYLPFKIFGSSIRPTFIILISGILFGLSHNYSTIYILNGVFAGLLFSYLYFLVGRNYKAIIITVLTHATSNLIAYLINNFLLS